MQDWPGTHRVNLSGTIGLLDAIRRCRRRCLSSMLPLRLSMAIATACRSPRMRRPARSPPTAPTSSAANCTPASPARLWRAHRGLRFFNVYGPRQDPRSPYSGVISIFCDRLRRGAPIDLFGDGAQTRDFVFVADVIAALLAAMRRGRAGPAVFNVCTGRGTSVRALADTIAGVLGVRAEIRQHCPRVGEVRHSVGNPARGRATLGLGAPTPLDRGLAATLASGPN